MKSSAQTETQMLSAIALFCYATSLVGIFVIGYSLIALALNAAGHEIDAIYSQPRL